MIELNLMRFGFVCVPYTKMTELSERIAVLKELAALDGRVLLRAPTLSTMIHVGFE
jgi:hypothetical protein